MSGPLNDQEKHQKRKAGKKSGYVRAGHANIRRLIVGAAFRRLSPANQRQPSSEHSIDALQEECLKLPTKINDDFDALLGLLLDGQKITINVSRDTLKKDLMALGIRSKRRVYRSG